MLIVAVLGAIYFLPAFVALLRYARNAWLVAALNLFLGWTVVGWAVAMHLACRSGRQTYAAFPQVALLPPRHSFRSSFTAGATQPMRPVWLSQEPMRLPSGHLLPGPETEIALHSVKAPPTRGGLISLCVEVPPSQLCTIDFYLPSGAKSKAQGLKPVISDSLGIARWTWRLSPRVGRGTGSVTIFCMGVRRTFEFSMQG